MKTIGLIGGMSWESSLEYYRVLNETIKARLGGLHSARCILYSVDFAEIEEQQSCGRWDESAASLVKAAQALESAGADFLLICTNTMHKLAPQIEASVGIPLLHIADATAKKVRSDGIERVGLLGTRFTMEEAFYAGRLSEHGLQVLIPPPDERQFVHRVIYEELCLGVINPRSRERIAGILSGLELAGAQGIILGCTEIELLLRSEDSRLPLFPTARIHAEAAVDLALS
jgi:aspartate racemase